jgi:hypothetical protein
MTTPTSGALIGGWGLEIGAELSWENRLRFYNSS